MADSPSKRRVQSSKRLAKSAQRPTKFSNAAEMERPSTVEEKFRLLAFYLPQFHPIPENDTWWEPGFTEWTNVSKATPLFKGHAQPRLPTELGFYDLRLPEIRRKQGELAKEYGIDGFCYYYYWFGGRRLLERPLFDMLADEQTKTPFCLCWANETWSRRWDGSETEILIKQEYSEKNLRDLIIELCEIFGDDRYIKVDGKPLIVVYRPADVPSDLKLPEIWREQARAIGVGELHICAALTFGLKDPRFLGYDAAVEFPPHSVNGTALDAATLGVSDFAGKIFDYAETVSNELRKPAPSFPCYRAVMAGWDNTARRGTRAHLFHNATPELYELWLGALVDQAKAKPAEAGQLVFINAWNEWAEGTYLEPDRLNGRAYLEATKRAKAGGNRESIALGALEARLGKNDTAAIGWLRGLNRTLQAQSRAIAALVDICKDKVSPYELFEPSLVLPQVPLELERPISVRGGLYNLDRLAAARRGQEAVHRRDQSLIVTGWHFVQGVPQGELSDLFFVLVSAEKGDRHFGAIPTRVGRADVIEHYNVLPADETLNAGFAGSLDLSLMPAGRYQVALASSSLKIAFYVTTDRQLLLV